MKNSNPAFLHSLLLFAFHEMIIHHAILQGSHSFLAYEVTQYLISVWESCGRTFARNHVAVFLEEGGGIFGILAEILLEARIAGSLLAFENACACQNHRSCADGTDPLACLVLGDERLAHTFVLVEVCAAWHSAWNHQHVSIFKTFNILKLQVSLDGNTMRCFYPFCTRYTYCLDVYTTSAEDVYRSQSFDFLEAIGNLKFAIFGNEYQAKKSASIEKILLYLEKKEAEVYVENAYYEFLTHDQQLNVKAAGVFEDYNFDVDYVISMGGDGTFLKAASRVGAKGTPIIGVNMGRLGFLADVLPSEIESALDSLYSGECLIEEHAVIQVEAEGGILAGNPFALNDIAVLKRDDASMISIRTQVDGEFLVTYQADGLIVTTPTGSTAYNLSNGGPIIIPQSGSICLTPVAPHSLNIRPIVINDTAVITLDIESRSHNYLVAIDGRSERMTEETRLIIRKAPHSIKIVKQRNQRYFSTLREKLMWGADQRER